MKKSRTGSRAREAVASPPVATVQVPLQLLDVLADTRTAFFGLCLDAGQQVLRTMMEQDRERLCEPKHVPNPARRGRRMVADHSKANQELQDLASQKDVKLPSALDAKQKAKRDQLAKLSGSAFDRAYMKAMTTDHVHDVAAFKKASQTAQDADVRGFASRTLPTLEDHLSEARRVQAQVQKGSGG